MKKALKAIGIIIGVLAICIGWLIYATEYKLDLRGIETSPDGQFSIVFHAVGDPDWPFGKTPLKVTVKDNYNRKKIEVIKTAVYDDGASLRDSNWGVEWRDGVVEITLKGSEQADVIYEVPLRQPE